MLKSVIETMKLTGLSIASLLIASCAVGPSFSGQSLADPATRNDVMGQVRMLYSAKYRCNQITAVNSAVDHVETLSNGAVSQVAETWTVNGCGESHALNIRLRPDPQGGTNYSVGVK